MSTKRQKFRAVTPKRRPNAGRREASSLEWLRKAIPLFSGRWHIGCLQVGLGLLGLAAGILWGYWCNDPPTPRPIVAASYPNPTTNTKSQPNLPRTPQARRPVAEKTPTPVLPSQSPPSVQLPGVCLVMPTPRTFPALPGGFLNDATADSQPLLQDDGKLWSQTMQLDLDELGGGEMLDFLSNEPKQGLLQNIEITNFSDVGAKYRLLQNEDTVFRGRLGGGLSREYARLEEGQRIPEVLLGLQFEHQISHRNKVLGAVEYARDVAEFGRYRVRTEAAYEVLLDPEKNLSLRTGVLKSSNMSPNGEQAKTVDYNVNMIWKF